MSPGPIVELEEEPGSDQEEEGGALDQDETQDQGGAQDQGEAQVYNLVRDRLPRQIQPPVRYGFEELAAYDLLTSSRDPSTFREAIISLKKIGGWEPCRRR